MSKEQVIFKHSGTSGDLVYWMACIKEAYRKYGRKAIIYQYLNMPGYLYEGAQHPYGGVMMNQYAFDMIKPLVLSQPYVDGFLPWNGERFMIDMDKVRVMKPLMPYGNIIKWLGYCYGDIMPDISKEWINLDSLSEIDTVLRADTYDKIKGKILINRTSRYQNQWINYFFLKEYQEHMLFAGLPEEAEAFNKQWSLQIPHLKIVDFLDLALAIKCCRFFIGNQSMCFALAEAMKTPRILEVCPFAPNVDPVGPNAYDFLYQEYFEYYVKDLVNRF